jgi:signal transduction histidine kinase
MATGAKRNADAAKTDGARARPARSVRSGGAAPLARELAEAREQQAATAEILRVISESRSGVQPVFDTIAASALRLCNARFSGVFMYDGTLIHIASLREVTPDGVAAFRGAYPAVPNRGGATQRAILTRSIVHIPDIGEDPEYAYHGVARTVGYRSVLGVPMLRDGTPIGVIGVYRDAAGSFPDSQIALLKTFAEQAVIAIENVRLFNALGARNRDLTESLEQQTATSAILRVISRSQTDVQPVFDAIVTSACALCDASFSGVFLLADGRLDVAATAGLSPADHASMHAAYPQPVGRGTAAGIAVSERRVVQVADMATDPQFAAAPGRLVGVRTVLSLPMMRSGEVIGAMSVWRKEVRPFTEAQTALFQTFADQAVIAIENARLFRTLEERNSELTESLDRQTATSEILRVISQSRNDVQPVFQTIADAAFKLCEASSANVFTFDGEFVHMAASANANPAAVEVMRGMYPRPPSRDLAATRAVLTNDVVAIPDVREDPDYLFPEHVIPGGFRSILGVPLRSSGRPIGAITVGRPQPGPFVEAHVDLLRTFADQAVIAIENVRLLQALEKRTGELTQSVGELRALGEVGQAVSSTLDLETVLRTIAARATELTGMDACAIYEYDEGAGAFNFRATDRLPRELVEALSAAPIPRGEGALGRMATTGQPVQIRDVADTREYQSRVREILVRLGLRSLLAVPLLCEGRLFGGLTVNRRAPGEFAPDAIELLKAFATQSALAIQNARLFREIEDKSRQLETASRHKSEFLANMSHELRTPLNAIIGFSEVLNERMFGEINDKQSEYVIDILESGRHLLALINDILDLSKIEAGRMELEPSEFHLPTAIDNTLTLVRERAERRGIALARDIDPRVGAVRADERKVKQVLLNLLSNALKFTPEGGRVDVRARARDGVREVSVVDTGVGIAAEDLEAVFEEFRQVGASTKKAEGTGLGLAISRKFIELHGGRLWVDSKPGHGSTFTFTLPA